MIWQWQANLEVSYLLYVKEKTTTWKITKKLGMEQKTEQLTSMEYISKQKV